MDTLEEYLATEFALDEEHLAAVDQLINEAAETLINSLQRNGWPYRVSRSQAETSKVSMSHSTLAMVSLSLWKLGGAWKKPLPLGPLPSFPPIKVRDLKALTETATKATELLIKAIVKHRAVKTKSKTYGDNDPVTLFFLAELSHVAGSPGGEIYWRHVRSYLKRRTSQLRRAANGDALQKQERLYIKLKDHEAVSNAMIPLRIVQALRLCRNGIEQDIPTFREYFETTLHDQLSYSAIPDSRFDPAELAFCLEGLLLSQRNAVDRGLFRRVFEVLKKAQEESAFWRPVKPFMATVKGMALFPVSVEVANSLIRSCEIFDGIDLHDTFGSHYIGLFHRYWQWVKARTVRFRKRDSEIVGWHSEHVNEIGAIHAWETSQVLEFLMAFRRLLQTHVARRTLTMSRFSVRDPEHPDGRAPLWTEICAKYEPVGSLGREYKVYSRIGSDFVFGWRDVEPLHYSMLLYGPPGSGKTTVANNIADALGHRLITITVSDFLAEGYAQLEARAKAIFDVLRVQPRCVVLFDEIDSFLLHRDSKRYREQDTVFQFMTPGMLTKLNDLRREKVVLCVIATNYDNRIDPAIKRTGRVDKRYLVLPPDLGARRRILRELVTKENAKMAGGGRLRGKRSADWDALAKESLFLGYTDIEGAVIDARRQSTGGNFSTQLMKCLKERARTTKISNYAARLASKDDYDHPIEELICLIGMALQEGYPLDQASENTLIELQKKLRLLGGNISEAIRLSAPGLKQHVRKQVARAFALVA